MSRQNLKGNRILPMDKNPDDAAVNFFFFLFAASLLLLRVQLLAWPSIWCMHVWSLLITSNSLDYTLVHKVSIASPGIDSRLTVQAACISGLEGFFIVTRGRQLHNTASLSFHKCGSHSVFHFLKIHLCIFKQKSGLPPTGTVEARCAPTVPCRTLLWDQRLCCLQHYLRYPSHWLPVNLSGASAAPSAQGALESLH